MFTTEELSLPGVLLIRPRIFRDARGYAMTAYDSAEFAELGITADFKQDFRSYSVKNVIRGLHFQCAPYAQDKLVRCTNGKIFDVVADYDSASATFGKYVSVILDAEEQMMLYVPGKYAHGFCVVSDDASVEYKISGEYAPESASGVLWNDPLLGITWPVADPVLSEKDRLWTPLVV